MITFTAEGTTPTMQCNSHIHLGTFNPLHYLLCMCACRLVTSIGVRYYFLKVVHSVT